MLSFETCEGLQNVIFTEDSWAATFISNNISDLSIALVATKGESHIDFRTQCVTMTPGGGRLSLMTFWKSDF